MSLVQCQTPKNTASPTRPLTVVPKPVTAKTPTFPNTIERMKHDILHTYFSYRETDMNAWAKDFPGDRDKIVVHIAARSGSTRLPRKNIEPINGKPLIAYTIETAKALDIDRIIVNTDDEEFAEIARHYGAETPFLRPAPLSTSDSPPGLSSYYAFRSLLEEGYGIKSFIDLYPTTPFRNAKTLKTYIAAMQKYGNVSTGVFPEVCCNALFSDGTHVPVAISSLEQKSSIQYTPISTFLGHNVIPAERPASVVFPITNPLELIDIDTRHDLELAEYAVRNNLYDFGRDQ
ncbi:hypothetical protein [Pseudodesulfovibrio sp. JC047]|uniref:cytidylyltransferase domain-containing protein n=1 Tax=Pseudodesulfovibrio sp. JC047 TaxID=2683199 RepID=UPI001EF30CB5|nr:hypothetical protein [Pseudodesulfovibrio sp. JC047]